jgi:hypothetical protein
MEDPVYACNDHRDLLYVQRHLFLSLNAADRSVVYTTGIIVRFPERNSPDTLGLYLITDLFIILSPCAFIGVSGSARRCHRHPLTGVV